MTERQGAFTVSTRLFLTAEQRARLGQLVHDQRLDLADLISAIVADHSADVPSAVAIQRQGTVVVPTRLYLTAEARQQIDQIAHAHAIDMADIVSWIVASYIDALPTTPLAPAPADLPSADLRQRRAELGRLRARRNAAGAAAPAWLIAYIAELEADIKRLES